MLSVRLLVFILFLMGSSVVASAGAIMVGDVEISPGDFSADQAPEQRLAKCLVCHGNRGGGDIDFGPDAHYGTPALRGMREDYLKESLIAYKTGTRRHQEMSVVSSMLDDETIDFMAGKLAKFEVPPMKSASELATLKQTDPLFRQGQDIALQGIARKGVPACMACHGPLGEGTTVGPRLAGQNVMYIENQFEAFTKGARQTAQSSAMGPIVSGLTDDEISAVAHYFSLLIESDQP